jgi:hypothetical protein
MDMGIDGDEYRREVVTRADPSDWVDSKKWTRGCFGDREMVETWSGLGLSIKEHSIEWWNEEEE